MENLYMTFKIKFWKKWKKINKEYTLIIGGGVLVV